jgi:hypothetical protein
MACKGSDKGKGGKKSKPVKGKSNIMGGMKSK